MKKLISVCIAFTFCSACIAQFAARLQIKEPVPGVCDEKNIYAMLPGFAGQQEAKCPLSAKEITKKLNTEVKYLKDSSNYNDKGMVSIIINCKGDVVRCKIDNKTKSSELDNQIVAVFNSLGKWKAGKLNDDMVDTVRLWSFEITNGMIAVK